MKPNLKNSKTKQKNERRKNIMSKNYQTKIKENNAKGITLIALVITIIVLLILAAVSIAMLTGQNGILTKASSAKSQTAQKAAEEQIKLVLADWQAEKVIKPTETLAEFFQKKLDGKEIDSYSGGDPFIVGLGGAGQYEATVSKDGVLVGDVISSKAPKVPTDTKVVANSDGTGDNVAAGSKEEGTTLYINFTSSIEGGTITSISPSVPYAVTKNGTTTFTITGTVGSDVYTREYTVTVNQYKIAAGSWVNYTAGTWTQAEIDSLGDLYQGSALPTTGFKFGGFQAGSSKDASITPYSTYANTYSSGWRVLNTDGGTINIVTAGTPEGYYNPGSSNDGYRSEYILSSGARQTGYNTTSSGTTLTPRNWAMYVNSTYADTAHCMTYDEAYNITNSTSSTSNDLRKTGSYYWLASAYSSYSDNLWNVFYVGSMNGNNYNCFGVRPVVSLKSGIQITGGTGTQADPYTIRIIIADKRYW